MNRKYGFKADTKHTFVILNVMLLYLLSRLSNKGSRLSGIDFERYHIKIVLPWLFYNTFLDLELIILRGYAMEINQLVYTLPSRD